MNTGKILEIFSANSKETEHIASVLAANLKGGELIEFSSDVGGGKTTFVKGLVAALGSHDHVASPTFTVAKEYATPRFRVCHFDFYRMQDPGLIAHALQEAALDDNTITCVEWSNIVEDVLPKERIIVTIQKDPTEENKRLVTLRASPSLAYCLEGLAS